MSTLKTKEIKFYLNFFLWSRIQTFQVEYIYQTSKEDLLRNVNATIKKYILRIYVFSVIYLRNIFKKYLFKYVWLVP